MADKKHIPGCDCSECTGHLLVLIDATLNQAQQSIDYLRALQAFHETFDGHSQAARASLKTLSDDYLQQARIAGINLSNMVEAERLSRATKNQAVAA